jgi:hypothetical protein
MSNVIVVISHGDAKHLDSPVDLTIKRNGAMSGLCNQLFRIVNAFVAHEPEKNTIIIDLAAADYLSGDVVPISELLDLKMMNRMYGLKVRDIVDFKPKHYIHTNDFFIFRSNWHNPPAFTSYVRKLIFSERFRQVGGKLAQHFGIVGLRVNLVHLRLESDMQAQINNKEECDRISEKYYHKITKHCNRTEPLVLLTGDCQHPLVTKLQEEYRVIYVSKELAQACLNPPGVLPLQGREVMALCDITFSQYLLVNHYICFDGGAHRQSSFSTLLRNILCYQAIHYV